MLLLCKELKCILIKYKRKNIFYSAFKTRGGVKRYVYLPRKFTEGQRTSTPPWIESPDCTNENNFFPSFSEWHPQNYFNCTILIYFFRCKTTNNYNLCLLTIYFSMFFSFDAMSFLINYQINDHKTSKTYGPALVCVGEALYSQLETY